MHLFIEKGMRGGISYIAKRHASMRVIKKKGVLFIGMQITCMAGESVIW